MAFNLYPKNVHSFIIKQPLKANERFILIFILERIYNFPKSRKTKSAPLSNSYISQGTGINSEKIGKYLKTLESKKYIKITQKETNNKPRIVSIKPLFKFCIAKPATQK